MAHSPGTKSGTSPATNGDIFAATFFPGVSASGKVEYNASIFRGGVNYKF
jgi:hypothetical protein